MTAIDSKKPIKCQNLCPKPGLPLPRDFAFRWHESPYAFERLSPPWEQIEVLEKSGSIDLGRVVIRSRVGPFWLRMRAQHSQFVPNEQFFDEMSGGPFRSWKHHHRFTSEGNETILTDQIEYQLKGGRLGDWLAGNTVRKRLEQMFAYRRQVTCTDIEDHYRYSGQAPKTIAVTGATGLVGKSVCEYLSGGGHRIIRLSRNRAEGNDSPGWDPESGRVHFGSAVQQVDSFLHLAGYGIAERRWNPKVKSLIRDSRIGPTQKLASYLAENHLVKESFICASATGFYGDRGDAMLDESSAPGEGFLAEVCQPWERACEPLESAGVRTVQTRFGIIQSARGGALREMLLPFKMGAGGRVGSGKQYWSWISLYDTLRAIHFSMVNENVVGPVNFTAPNPVPQSQYAKILGKVLFRPSFFPFPGWAAKLALGEMATYLLLMGSRVQPRKLIDCGFKFIHNNLEEALRFELGRQLKNQQKVNQS